MIGPELVFVEGDMMSNKYWAGLVKCSEEQRLVDLFVYNRIVRKYNT